MLESCDFQAGPAGERFAYAFRSREYTPRTVVLKNYQLSSRRSGRWKSTLLAACDFPTSPWPGIKPRDATQEQDRKPQRTTPPIPKSNSTRATLVLRIATLNLRLARALVSTHRFFRIARCRSLQHAAKAHELCDAPAQGLAYLLSAIPTGLKLALFHSLGFALSRRRRRLRRQLRPQSPAGLACQSMRCARKKKKESAKQVNPPASGLHRGVLIGHPGRPSQQGRGLSHPDPRATGVSGLGQSGAAAATCQACGSCAQFKPFTLHASLLLPLLPNAVPFPNHSGLHQRNLTASQCQSDHPVQNAQGNTTAST